jgi:hypothetical protein
LVPVIRRFGAPAVPPGSPARREWLGTIVAAGLLLAAVAGLRHQIRAVEAEQRDDSAMGRPAARDAGVHRHGSGPPRSRGLGPPSERSWRERENDSIPSATPTIESITARRGAVAIGDARDARVPDEMAPELAAASLSSDPALDPLVGGESRSDGEAQRSDAVGAPAPTSALDLAENEIHLDDPQGVAAGGIALDLLVDPESDDEETTDDAGRDSDAGGRTPPLSAPLPAPSPPPGGTLPAGGLTDECPNDPDKSTPGACGCGVADSDTDSDGVEDCIDPCPAGPNDDSDGDGTADCIDGCPNDPAKIDPGTCGCGVSDADADGDGAADCNDGCPLDSDKIAPGTCGCGEPDIDSDGDGSLDCLDGCPNDGSKSMPGNCGCGTPDMDSDGDGLADCIDPCPADPNDDTDGDGTLDCGDGCPLDPLKTAPGACGCSIADDDTDADGAADCFDGCPLDPMKTSPGFCGCGVSDDDSDGDGAIDCLDGCPFDPLKLTPGACGCGISDGDSDGDGAADCVDGCPFDPLKFAPGECGCGAPNTDTDGDGAADCIDGCPNDPAKIAPGACGCGVADIDSDGDGFEDCNDACPGGANDDNDGDGTLDCNDGCPLDPNKIEPGACGCGAVDTDTDGDGTADCLDGCPLDPLKITSGECGCGALDTDTDGDGTADCLDACPSDPLKTSPGACGCGSADDDLDGDGTADCLDGCPNDPLKTAPGACGCGAPDDDGDGDGVADCVDNCPAIANPLQEDCDGNATGDVCDLAAGAPDLDVDAELDVCEVQPPELMLSFLDAAVVPGALTIENEDIAAFTPANDAWRRLFDGSDLVPTTARVDGFALLGSGPTLEILLSFSAAIDLPAMTGGPGGSTLLDDSDIVRFTPASTGDNTAGALAFYFDGSDVGLTTSGEDMDALATLPDGRLVISTTGGGSATGLSWEDEDLIVFNDTSLGEATAGAFAMLFDGSDVGLSTSSNEDVDAADILPDGRMLLSTIGDFSVAGAAGSNEDLLVFTATTLGTNTAGAFEVLMDLSAEGIDPSEDVTAIALLTEPPAVAGVAGDMNGSNIPLDVALPQLFADWGACADPSDCPSDLTGDGVVDGADLALLLES